MTEWSHGAVGFIGAGNMAEAIVRGIIAQGVVPADRIVVADPSAARTELFAAMGATVAPDNRALVAQCRVVVLSVKPQVMAAALAGLDEVFTAEQVVISIAAGLSTATIDGQCGGRAAVVRVMPNTPALVGRGVSAICAGPRAGERALVLTGILFGAVGCTVRVDEAQMDAVTAVSGSGPAYVFYWMESMLRAAGELGLDAATARSLVMETVGGAAALAVQSDVSPEELRARVTSKGGTTEAAINALNQAGVGDALVAAVKAAAARSRALSGG
jgi:pyrroline-5-carboxylate reductase